MGMVVSLYAEGENVCEFCEMFVRGGECGLPEGHVDFDHRVAGDAVASLVLLKHGAGDVLVHLVDDGGRDESYDD